jgi:PAS domain-containing protein
MHDSDVPAKSGAKVLNWPRIEEWTSLILADDIAAIGAVFQQHGAGKPGAVRNPSPEQIPPLGPLRFLAQHWQTIAAAGLPHLREIDPFKLRPALGYLMVLEPVEDGRDFSYRLYGSTLARVSGFEMTGRRVSEHPASAYVAEFSIAINRAVLKAGVPIYTTRRPVGAELAMRWHRLTLPFLDDSGTPARILAGIAAIDSAGRLVKT